MAIVARTRNNVQVNRLFALHDTRVAVSQKKIINTQDLVHQLELFVDDVHHGFLIKCVIPRDMLSSIVDDDLPLEWYYRWIEIIPI